MSLILRQEGSLTLRKRDRFDASPSAGLCQTWTEWQVVLGRKIIERCYTEDAGHDAFQCALIQLQQQPNQSEGEGE